MVFSALRIFALLGVLGAAGVRGAQYGLAKDYSGPGFFNDWVFYDHCMFKPPIR